MAIAQKLTEIQRGVATLTAGSVAVTFADSFSRAPDVYIQPQTGGTALTQIYPASIATTGFTAVSHEMVVSGGTFATVSGTKAVSTFNWVALLSTN